MMNYELDLLEIIICQGVVRRMLAHKEVERRRSSIQVIQNFFRCSIATMLLRRLQEQQKQCMEEYIAAVNIQVRPVHTGEALLQIGQLLTNCRMA